MRVLINFLFTFPDATQQTHHYHGEPIKQTRLLILSYYRSGSSFVGDFFMKDVFYQFEPARSFGDHFYGNNKARLIKYNDT